ncbi:unnamed protein product, partial [Lymnaea stagnalis]
MDYGSDADPMISSVSSFGMLDFDPYSRPTMLDEPPNNIDMSLDSPASIETYH